MKIRIPYLLVASIAVGSLLYLTSPQGLSASPVVTLTSIDGEQFDLARSGKARLVSFYSPDCPISSRDIPNLKAAHERSKTELLEVIAIAMPYDNPHDIAQLQESKEIPYAIAHDTDGSIGAAFPDVRFTPTTFLIDTNGKIVWRHVGRLRNEKLDNEIEAALAPQQLAKK